MAAADAHLCFVCTLPPRAPGPDSHTIIFVAATLNSSSLLWWRAAAQCARQRLGASFRCEGRAEHDALASPGGGGGAVPVEGVVELAEVGEDAAAVQLLALLHVPGVEQRGDPQLPLRHSEGQLAVPGDSGLVSRYHPNCVDISTLLLYR